MVNKRIVHRGDVAIPFEGGAPAGVARPGFPVLGPHLYLGKNRWWSPVGIIEDGQRFHRQMLSEIKRGWWKVVR